MYFENSDDKTAAEGNPATKAREEAWRNIEQARRQVRWMLLWLPVATSLFAAAILVWARPLGPMTAGENPPVKIPPPDEETSDETEILSIVSNKDRDVSPAMQSSWSNDRSGRTDGSTRPASPSGTADTTGDDIQMHARRWQSAETEPRAGDRGIVLRSVPNRPTRFEFLLTNRTGRERHVRLKLVAVPEELNERIRDVMVPGRLFRRDGNLRDGVYSQIFDNNGEPKPHVRVLAVTPVNDPIRLPADNRVVPVHWSAPESSRPASEHDDGKRGLASAAAPLSSSEPPPPESSPKLDISHGLVCQIEDADGQAERWLQWLEVTALRADEYYRADVRYDEDQRRLWLRFAPRLFRADGSVDWPPGIESKPVEIHVDSPSPGWRDLRRVTRGQLNGRQPELELYADVSSEAQAPWLIYSHVDGVDRAFVHRVTLKRGETGSEELRSYRQAIHIDEVRLSAIGMDGPTQVVVRIPGAGHEYDKRAAQTSAAQTSTAQTSAARQRVLTLSESDVAALPPAEGEVEVRFHVDAPQDAFAHDARSQEDDADRVEVGFDGSAHTTVKVLADRQRTTTLAALTSDGCELVTEVTDLRVTLPAPGLSNGRYGLTAKLILCGDRGDDERESVECSHTVPFVFDDNPPEVVLSVANDGGKSTSAGTDARIALEVEDLSGVGRAELEFWNETNERKHVTSFAESFFQGDRTRWLLPVSTKSLEPGRYEIRAKVTDRAGMVAAANGELRLVPRRELPKTGVILGQVTINQTPVNNFLVEISGSPPRRFRTGKDGRFEFKDVPLGTDVTVTANGVDANQAYRGSMDIKDVKETQTINIEVRKRRP